MRADGPKNRGRRAGGAHKADQPSHRADEECDADGADLDWVDLDDTVDLFALPSPAVPAKYGRPMFGQA